jgi:hypothetical protein
VILLWLLPLLVVLVHLRLLVFHCRQHLGDSRLVIRR